jgi:EmrB/QacA subfamily drug resistance transporter
MDKLKTIDSGSTNITSSRSNKHLTLITMCLTVFISAFMSSAINVAIPTIGQEFHADAVSVGWIATAFILAISAFSLPCGRVADIVGLKKSFLWGVIVFTIACPVAAFSNSITMLIICRAIQGLAGAMILGNSVALLMAIYPANQRGQALGINVASTYIGVSLGPLIGGLFTQHLGWRSIFWITVPIGLFVIFFTIWKVREKFSDSRGERFDNIGAIISTLGLIALFYGFSILPDILGIIITLMGIAGLLVFVKWENRVKKPLMDMQIFHHNRVFIFTNLAALINYSSTFSMLYLMNLYLQYIKGLTPVQTGLIIIVHPVTQTIVSPIAGRLSDKVEPRIVASIGMALSFAGILAYSFNTQDTSLIWIILVLIILGAGLAMFTTPNVNAGMSSVEPRYYGVASAILNIMRAGGNTLSMGIVMVVMSVIIGKVAITPDTYHSLLMSMKIIFVIFAVLCVGGAAASLIRGKIHSSST